MITIAQDALLTAFVTANLFIVLPILVERSRTLLAERRAKDGGTDGERENELVDVLVPTSFNFPHGAKVLSIGFVLFAGCTPASSPGRALPRARRRRAPRGLREHQHGDPVPARPRARSGRPLPALRGVRRP